MRLPRPRALAALVLVAGLLAGASGEATVRSLRIDDPRSYAWFIGDLMTRELTVEVVPGFTLDAARLPAPGEVNHWLELVSVQARSRGQTWRIELVYRLNNRPEDDGLRVLPGFKVYTTNGSRSVPTNVSEFVFTQAAVVPARTLERLDAGDVRPDRPPPRAPSSAHLVRTVMLSLAVGVLALYLFYCHFGAVWLSRWRRPFTAALRDLRRDAPKGRTWTLDDEARGLRRFHEAVNEAAGRVVLRADLDTFLAARPLYAVEREGLERLFARSQRVFFGELDGGEAERIDRDRLLGLCRRLSVVELSTP